MKHLAYQFSLSLWILLGFTGCGTVQRKAKLEESVEQYARALKGAETDLLMAYVKPESQEEFSAAYDRLKGLQFSNVEVRRVFPSQDMSSAIVVMDLEYFLISEQTLMSSVRQYRWVYDDRAKAWMMADSSPMGSK